MAESGEANEAEVFEFLRMLRDSGKINMFEAPSVLMEAFGMDWKTAKEFFIRWSRTFRETD